MKYLLIVLFLAMIVVGCDNGKCYHRLTHIDTLLYKDMDDSARNELNRIALNELKNSKDFAYYRLLKTQIIFRQGLIIQNDSMIDRSIAYYENVDDKHKLAQAYYFKGRMLYKRGEDKDAMSFLKKAEHEAKDVDDNFLKAKIYMSIGNCNCKADDFLKALGFFEKALTYARLAHNREFILLNLENISVIYSYLDKMDSSLIYMKEYIPLIESTPRNNHATAFANVAAYYEYIDVGKAKTYAHKSINIKPTSIAYHVIASIYANEKKYFVADSCFRMAFNLSNELGQKISILQGLLELKMEMNELHEVATLSKRIITLRDSFSIKEREDSVKEIQQLYELSAIKEESSRSLGKATMLILFLFGGLIVGGTLVVVYRRRAKNGVEEHKRIIDHLIEERAKLVKKVEMLSSDKDNKKKQIAGLKRKIKTIETRQDTLQKEMESRMNYMLTKGKMLYEGICSGGNITKWSSDDATCFTEYYVSTNKDFVARLSDGYAGLTDNRKIFLILQDMQKDNDEICRIMNIKSGTLRVLRMRTKGIFMGSECQN